VVEPDQITEYEKRFGINRLLILPENNMQLLGARLWIREHSIKQGHERHWQFDDNIRYFQRLNYGKRIWCDPNIAIKVVEDFTDRYTNIGISGFNYEMFAIDETTKKPFYQNVHVYSASLINNRMPYKWRLFYNDDTDLCLQVLHGGLCTVLFNAFTVGKIATMKVGGGNTHELYQGDGRLRMARTLEAIWPQYVQVKWRWNRPQHVINWKKHFRQPFIRRSDLDWSKIKETAYDIKLIRKKEIRSKELIELYDNYKNKTK
jgi:hypothetical protein